jgi:uncharacterized membrane protein
MSAGTDPLAETPDLDVDDAEIEPLPERTISDRVIGWLLTVGGLVGLFGSAMLVYERIQLLLNPDHELSCDFSVWVSCGTVIGSWQATLFGDIPNPMIGMAAFPVVATLGIAVLSGVRLPAWIWRGLNVGALLGAVFITWLFTQSVYDIQALCPYCMVVWVVTIPIFVYTTAYNLARGHVPAPAGLRKAIVGSPGLIVVAWYAIIAILIFVQFRAMF